MRLNPHMLLLVPILLVGAVLAALLVLPPGLVDAAVWWITGLSGLSIAAHLMLGGSERPARSRWVARRSAED